MKARVYLLLALSFVALVLTGCLPRPQGTPVRDDQGRVIARLEPNAPVVVLRRSDAGMKILLSGWVDADLAAESDNSLWEIENYPGLFYGRFSYEQGLGYTEMIGVLDNRTDTCFDLLTLEVSLWQGDKEGGTVKEVTMESLRRVLPGERVPFDVLFLGWELDDLLKMTPRFRYRDGIEC